MSLEPWSASIGASASEEAAKIQAGLTAEALKMQENQYQQSRADMMPWLNAGKNALVGQSELAGNLPDLSSSAYEDSAYNKWIRQQGVNSLMASGAAKGAYGSGNLGTALVEYGQNASGSQYTDWWNKMMSEYNTKYNTLASLSGTGQVAASSMANTGTNYANSSSNLLTNLGYSQAQGLYGQANAWQNALTGTSNQLMGGLGSYLNYQQNQNLVNQLSLLNNRYGNLGVTGNEYGGMTDFASIEGLYQ